MIPLVTSFRSKGFDFVQIAREERHAIFRKTKPGYNFEVFEVVVIQQMAEHTWPNGHFTPAHECMPGNEVWGSKGWTCQTQERAWEKFRENIFLSSLTKKDAFSDPKPSVDRLAAVRLLLTRPLLNQWGLCESSRYFCSPHSFSLPPGAHLNLEDGKSPTLERAGGKGAVETHAVKLFLRLTNFPLLHVKHLTMTITEAAKELGAAQRDPGPTEKGRNFVRCRLMALWS